MENDHSVDRKSLSLTFLSGFSGDKVKAALQLNGLHYHHIPCIPRKWADSSTGLGSLAFLWHPIVPGHHGSRSPWSWDFGRRQTELGCSCFVLTKDNCIRSLLLPLLQLPGAILTVTAVTAASCVPSILMSTDSCQELLCAPGGNVVSSRLTSCGGIDW